MEEHVTVRIEREVNSPPYRTLQNLVVSGASSLQSELPPQLAKVHDVFHVSLLRKADMDLAWILPQVPVKVKEDLTFKLMPIRILDQEVKEL